MPHLRSSAAGLASLRQAIDSIERTEAAEHLGSESLQAFRRNASVFRQRLQAWSNNPTYAQHADLLTAFHRLEQEADRIDADTRAQLHALLYQQRLVFVVALSAAALLLAGLCAAVLLAGRGREASQAQTRRAEQGWRDADQALQRSEARFRDTFEHAAVGIAHITLDGRFLRVYRKLCDILGYGRKEL